MDIELNSGVVVFSGIAVYYYYVCRNGEVL